MNLKFKHKILIAQYFSIIIFFLFCIYLYFNSSRNAEKDIPAIQKSFELQYQMGQLKFNVVQIQQWVTDISATRGEDGLDDGFKKAAESYSNALANIEEIKKLNSYFLNKEIKESIEKIISSLKNYHETGIKMGKTYIKDGTKAGNLFMPEFDKASEDIQKNITDLDDIINQILKSGANNLKNDLLYISKISLFSPFILLIIISIFVFKFVAKMDLQFQQIVSGLIENSSDLEGASISLLENSQQLFKSVESQSRDAEITSSAVHEISSMVDNNAEYSKTAQKATTESVGLVESGKSILEKALDSINDLSENNANIVLDIEELNRNVSEMVMVIKEVNDKTKVINDIVFQTKLLSFNASVEAARAGEQGKGFSVVAEEVGNLAQMSGKAAQEISNILSTSISKVNDITSESASKVEHIKKTSTEKINSSKEVILEAKASIESIFDNVKIVDEMNKEITLASQEQSIGVRDVNKSLQSLSNSIIRNKEVAEESAEQASILNTQAISLGGTIKNFLSFIEGEGEGSFDFKTAISAHLGWRSKLNNYLNVPDGSLKEDTVCKDNQCALGKWIYGEGVKYKHSHTTLYSNLLNSHAEFHKNVGQIVSLINNGDKESAIEKMRPKSEYILSSKKTVALIKEMQKIDRSFK